MPRRSKLTPELQARICKYIEEGYTIDKAVPSSGIGSALLPMARRRNTKRQIPGVLGGNKPVNKSLSQNTPNNPQTAKATLKTLKATGKPQHGT